MPTYRTIAVREGMVAGICEGGYRQVAGPCGCGCPTCCGTGNQCAVYALKNAQAVAQLADCVNGPGIQLVPWAGAVDGWTRLGTAFDIACRVDLRAVYQEGPIGFEEIQDFTWTDRFRLGPVDATAEQLADLLGQPANPAGWVRVGLLKTYASAVDLTGQVCTALWVDSGPVTGRFKLRDTVAGLDFDEDIDSFLDYTRGGVLPEADDLTLDQPVPAWRPTQAVFVQGNAGQVFSPLRCDGLTWQPWDLHPLGPVGMPRPVAGSFGDIAGITGGIYPYQRLTGPDGPGEACQRTLDRFVLARIGGAGQTAFTAPCSVPYPGTHTASLAVDHGFAARFELRHAVLTRNCIDEPLTDTLDCVVEASVSVVTPCAGAETLEPISCGATTELMQMAVPCGGGAMDADPIVVDPATRPPDGETVVWNQRRYRPTGIASLGKPVGEWSTVPCQDVRLAWPCNAAAGTEPYPYLAADRPAGMGALRVGEAVYRLTDQPTSLLPRPVDEWLTGCPTGRYICEICDPLSPIAEFTPAEMAYEVNPVIGVGLGTVIELVYNPVTECLHAVWYRPTSEPATDEPLAFHHATGPACRPSDIIYCVATGDLPQDIGSLCQSGLCFLPNLPPGWRDLCDRACGARATDTTQRVSSSGAPAVPDPMAAQMAYWGCKGCGDPGV